jgi:hypothetical protein
MTTIQEATVQDIATDVEVYTALADARREHTPMPLRAYVNARHYDRAVNIHVHTEDERRQWERWWTRHGAGGWTEHTSTTEANAHHYASATWREWTVQLVHLTPLPTAVPA